MGVAGSPWAVRLSSPATRQSSMMLPCGFFVSKDAGSSCTLTAMVQDCYFYRYHLREKKYRIFGKAVWPTRKRNGHVQVKVSYCPSEKGVAMNGAHAKLEATDGWEETRKSLNASLQYPETGKDLVHMLHESAQIYHVAVERQISLSAGPWFSKAWLSIDQKDWIKSIGYQAAVHALLQAALEITTRREGRVQDGYLIVQQSLLHLGSPLEASIKYQLSSRDRAVEEWLWHQRHPVAVSNFVSTLEKDPRFTAVTSEDWEWLFKDPSKESNVAVISLALSVCAAIKKLGPAKLSCSSFSSVLSEEMTHLLNLLIKFTSINQIYVFTSNIGLKQEFFSHFAPRAASIRSVSVFSEEEKVFWVEIFQELLRGALARECIHARFASHLDIEVVERDLAVFGFFSALGRRVRSFLAQRNVDDLHDLISSLFRYLEGGCVLFYPELATLTVYQLFVEVVNEELILMPFFQDALNISYVKEGSNEAVSKEELEESIFTALNVCSCWVEVFIKYSRWFQRAESVHAMKFLSYIRCQLDRCFLACSLNCCRDGSKMTVTRRAASKVEKTLKRLLFEDTESNEEEDISQMYNNYVTFDWVDDLESELSCMTESDGALQELQKRLRLFDKDLQNAEDVLLKLETLLKSSELSLSHSGGEHLTTIEADLQRIWQLKKEAEVLKSSLKVKAALKENMLKQPEALDISCVSIASNGSLAERGISSGSRRLGKIFSKSLKTLKNASTDALKGTQLLTTDVAYAVALIMRSLSGHELTEREQKILKRAFTDLASIIPISVLMLLPVTAIGHAAILAAIQKYIPSLIPSAYAPERIELLKQLEQLKQMEVEPDGLHLEFAACTPDSDAVKMI
eukprot:c28931_g1_i3 orf=712-3279(+)